MSEPKPDLQLEIAHVLFIDIVGYSKLFINEQHELLQELNQIVRSTDAFRAADIVGKLIRVPTGDGMALVFSTTPDAPVQCALEISKALQSHPELQVRMGVHSGPVSGLTDVDDRLNVAGAGINMAQRVMDCGDAGHILLSKRVAEDLEQYRQWRPYLHDLGECEVKHGARVNVVNFYTDDVGNRAIPEKFKKEQQAYAAAPSTKSANLRKPSLIAGALLVAIALAIGFWLFSRPGAQKSTKRGAAALASVTEKTIAVLPFKPLVPENRDQVLELGMADSLIAKLSNIREIIVRSLNSVRKYGGLEQDPLSAGRELEVNSVLEGNVQKSGDRIRVTARLISVADGSSLWANTFDEKFTDVFAVQDAISQKVADALALRLSGEENKRVTRRYTDNVEAYQLYLTGRYHWNKLTPPEITKSIEFFKQAIDLDPTYALAYFGLAEAYRSSAPTSDVPPKDVLPQAKAAAAKALEIDESLAEPHVTLAFIYNWFDWDWAGSEREAKRAIELNPNLGLAHIAYAQLLSHLGRHEEAITEGVRARELDPLSLIINTLNGSNLYQARRYDEADASLRKTLEMDPNFWIAHLFLGKTYLSKKEYPEAIAEFTKAREISGGNSEAISMAGCVWAIAGDAAKARAVLNELKALANERYVPSTNLAALYCALGEKDEAIAWLDKAYEDRDIRLNRLKVEPKWDSIRSDPRFVAIVKRMGLQ
jgi:TolB-like protein/tetratricopeptide (TPR) repeat protein/class 3 adenylate cyclase